MTRDERINRWVAAGYSRQQAELIERQDTPAPTVTVPLKITPQPSPTVAASNAIRLHRAECGDVGDVGDVGDLGSNAK